MEVRTKKYLNNAEGIAEKNRDITEAYKYGWTILNENIEQGHMKGSQACCLATICLPLGFAAGRTEGKIIVSYTRESEPTDMTATSEWDRPLSGDN